MVSKTALKERPLLYSGPMVKATLRAENPKTQTRRLRGLDAINADPNYWKFLQFVSNKKNEMCAVFVGKKGEDKIVKCPYGQPGDRLWVRETWWHEKGLDFENAAFEDGMMMCKNGKSFAIPLGWKPTDKKIWRKRPSIHMPRCASRIDLEIVKVRVERLWDISEEDAKAEGVVADYPAILDWAVKMGELSLLDEIKARGAKSVIYFGFMKLWAEINGLKSMNLNPWVWVLEFKRIRP